MIDLPLYSGFFVYYHTLPLKTKVPPWFAVHVGSVVETVGAKIQPFFHSNTIFLLFFLHFVRYHSFMLLFFLQNNSAVLPSFSPVQSVFCPFLPTFHPSLFVTMPP